MSVWRCYISGFQVNTRASLWRLSSQFMGRKTWPQRKKMNKYVVTWCLPNACLTHLKAVGSLVAFVCVFTCFVTRSQGITRTVKMCRWSTQEVTLSSTVGRASTLWSWRSRRPSYASWRPSCGVTAPTCCPSLRPPLRRPLTPAPSLTSKVKGFCFFSFLLPWLHFDLI